MFKKTLKKPNQNNKNKKQEYGQQWVIRDQESIKKWKLVAGWPIPQCS